MLLIRADGGPRVGGGHLMRTLAIGQAWQHAGGEVHYLVPEEASAFQGRLVEEGFVVHHCDDVTAPVLAQRLGARRAIVDGYEIDESVVLGLQAVGASVLLVDDNGERRGSAARWILNGNFHAPEVDYGGRTEGMLLGLRYTPLRSEFRNGPQKIRTSGNRILVTLGASDPDNTTSSVVRALSELDWEFELRVILGPAFRHRDAFFAVREELGLSFEVVEAPDNMVDHYSWADAAITAAGSSTWELIALRLPQCALVIADNQKEVAGRLAALGTLLAGDGAEVRKRPSSLVPTVERLLKSFEPQYPPEVALLDGRGALRVVDVLQASD